MIIVTFKYTNIIWSSVQLSYIVYQGYSFAMYTMWYDIWVIKDFDVVFCYLYRCARHPQVPSYCTLTQDPNDACCQSVYCPIQPTAAPTKPGQVTPGPGMPNPYTPPAPLGECVNQVILNQKYIGGVLGV